MINCALSALTSERFAGSGSGRRTAAGEQTWRSALAGRHESVPGLGFKHLRFLRLRRAPPRTFHGVRSGVLLIACWSRLPR